MMALAGVPFLFSGFWSKEAILHAAADWDVSRLPLVRGPGRRRPDRLLHDAPHVPRCSAGAPRSPAAAQAHESPAVMTVPLVDARRRRGRPRLPRHARVAVAAVEAGRRGRPEPHSLLEGGGLMALSIVLVGRRPRRRLGALRPAAARRPHGRPIRSRRRLPRLFGFLGAADEVRRALRRHASAGLNGASARRSRTSSTAGSGAAPSGSLGAGSGNSPGSSNREADEAGLNAGFDAVSERLRGTGRAYSRRPDGRGPGLPARPRDRLRGAGAAGSPGEAGR